MNFSSFPRFFRTLVSLVAGVILAGLLVGCGEQNKVYNLAVYVESYNIPPRLAGLKDGLKGLGYIEGKNYNLQVVDTTSMSPEQAKAALKGLADKNFDAFIALNTTSAQSLKQIAGNKPILGAGIEEPVRLGVAQSNERPGSNVTGVDYTLNELIRQDLGWLVKMKPSIKAVYLLYNPQNPSQTNYLEALRAEATRLNVKLVEKNASPQEAFKTVSALNAGEAQAILLLDFAVPYITKDLLQSVVQREKFLMNGIEPGNYNSGTTFIYAANDYAIGRQSAAYLDKILHGANPAELPFLQPAKFELHLNQQVANSIGFQFPEAILSTADEVIR